MATWRDGTAAARTPSELDTAAAVVGSGAALPGLPNAQVYPAGALFCRTTDFTLWRSTGAAWNQVSGVPQDPAMGGDLTGTASNAQIAAGAITNADINAGAGIVKSKLAALGIVDADVAAGAAIAEAKLALLDRTQQPYGIGTPGTILTALAVTTNSARGMRWTVAKTGSITDMMVYTSVASGNFQLGIYDTAATTRHLLRATAIVASTVTAGYQPVPLSSPLSVVAGDDIDLAIWSDNVTLTFGRAAAYLSNNSTLLPTGWLDGPGVPRHSWQVALSAAGLADFAEASMTLQPQLFCWVKYA